MNAFLIRCRVICISLLYCLSSCAAAAADYHVGDTVTLAQRDAGIPGHANVGEAAVSERITGGTSAKIIELGAAPHTHWLKIEAGQTRTWIISKYVSSVQPATPQPPVPPQTLVCTIGCWNIEWLHSSKTRGFPEYNSGGPQYPARTDAQLQALATVIQANLGARLLVLTEINGHASIDPNTGESRQRSTELDALLTHLSGTWAYQISASGGDQRIALLYDSAMVRVNEVLEIQVPPLTVQDSDIFFRDPLAAHVTLMANGQPQNDLVVIGVHLASGQNKAKNHDRAMEKLRERLAAAQAAGNLGGTGEHDVVIMGDFNANMFAPPAEQFFLDMDEATGTWDVLADGDYPATRLSGVPLKLRESCIDYIIASRKQGNHKGLVGEEIAAATATVHTGLLSTWGEDNFRAALSDHLPVTVTMQVMADSD